MPSPEMQGAIDMVRSFLGSIPSDLTERRAMDAQVASFFPPLDADINVEQLAIAGISAEWVWTEGADGQKVVLYCHGGGFISGSPSSVRPYVGRLAKKTGYRFLSIDYRLAPEHPCPAGIQDAVTAYGGLLEMGIPSSCIVFGGDSAGGGLALGALVALKDAGLPMPAGAFAVCPFVDMTLTSKTMTEEPNADLIAPFAEYQRIVAHYLAGADPAWPLASPVYADMQGFPPLHLEVTTERLLDEVRQVVLNARQAGVDATYELTPGCFHNFVQVVPDAPETIAADQRITEHVQRWLG